MLSNCIWYWFECSYSLIRYISSMMVCSYREEKDRWIRAKYELCEYLPPLPYADIALSQASDVLYVFITSSSGAVAKYCDEYICMCFFLCVCVFVCLSVRISPEPHMQPLQIFCACCLWLCLGPPPASLQYVMYFRLCG